MIILNSSFQKRGSGFDLNSLEHADEVLKRILLLANLQHLNIHIMSAFSVTMGKPKILNYTITDTTLPSNSVSMRYSSFGN